MWTDVAREQYKNKGRRYPSDLTDTEWQTIEPVLSSYATLTVDLREMVNACLYLEKAGCPWRFLPKEFGPWQTVRTSVWPALDRTWHDRFRSDGVARTAPRVRHRRPANAGGAPEAGPNA